MKVICVNANVILDNAEWEWPLKEGEVYNVENTLTCSCGETLYDVGIVTMYSKTMCRCGNVKQGRWFYSERFRLLDDLDIIEEGWKKCGEEIEKCELMEECM